MKKGLSIVVLLIIWNNLWAQGKYDANWVFGYKAGMNFLGSTPSVFVTNSNDLWSSAALSDSDGNLLFYVAPDTVASLYPLNYPYAIYNSNNEILPGGDSINIANIAHDNVLFLIQDSFFLLFYVNEAYDTVEGQMENYDFLYYSKIIKTSGGYKVTQKNRKVFNENIEQSIAAVKHANGKDWWLLAHKDAQGIVDSATNRFYKLLVTADTILGPYIQDVGELHSSLYCIFGGAAFNNQGTMFATALADQDESELFQFDRCTGNLSGFQLLSTPGFNNLAACAFSSSGDKLYLLGSPGYFNDSGYNALYQFSVDTSGVNNTEVTIWEERNEIGLDQPYLFQFLALAPDNKIYVAVSASSAPYFSLDSDNQYLWVINDPDSADSLCNFQPYGFFLGDSIASYASLPQMPNYNLGPLNSVWASTVSGDTSFCFGDTSITGVPLQVDTAPGVSFQWLPGPGIDSLNAAYQYVLPMQSTWYYVTFTDTAIVGSCQSRTDSIYVQVIHCCDSLLLSQCTLSKDTFICTDEDTPTKGATLQIDTVPGVSFIWQPGFGIDTNHVTRQIVDPPQSTWYYCTFYVDTYYEAATCRRTDSVYVEVKKCDTTGIQQVNNSIERLIIYPNPTQNMATVEWQDDNAYNEATLMIYDVLGREVSSQQINSGKADPSTTLRMTLDVSGLEDGLYVVKVMSPSGGGVGGGILGSAKLAVIK